MHITLHRSDSPEATLSWLLARHPEPGAPVPIGLFRAIDAPTFDRESRRQTEAQVEAHGAGTLEDLLEAGDRWTV